MDTLNVAAHDAGRLLTKALRPRLTTLRDPEYAHLLNRYRADPDFRLLVESMATGLELVVLEAGETALWVAPADQDSLFAASLTDVRERIGDVDKGLLALVQVAIAAALFPQGRLLSESSGDTNSATLDYILNGLVELCEQLRGAHEDDAELADAGLREAWRAVLAKPLRQPQSSRAALSSLEGIVRTVLSRLEDYGLLKRESGGEADFWLPTPRYRAQLRELAANTIFRKCVMALTDADGGAADA